MSHYAPSHAATMVSHITNTDNIAFSHKVVFSGLSGAIATTVIYPIDCIKTNLQNQQNGRLNALQLTKSIVTREGLRGLYRGWPPNVLFVMPEKAIKLTMNDYFKKQFRIHYNGNRPDLPLKYEMASGGLAGLCQVIATNPMELLKIQGATMAQRIKAGQLDKPIPYTTLIKQLGVTGLYTGVAATLLRDVPFSMIYFSLYTEAKHYLMGDQPQGFGIKSFGAGAIAGTVAAAVTCPLDVIKTRVHANVKPAKLNFSSFVKREISSMNHYYREIVSREGYRALLKGIGPRCLIISPLFGITMFCYEEFQQLIG